MGETTKGTKSKIFNTTISKYFLLIVTVLLAVCAGIIEPSFFRTKNLLNIISASCVMGIMGIGLSLIMITGEIDFASGAELSTGGVVIGLIMSISVFHNYYLLGVLITVCVLILFALFNSFLHIKIGIPSFIATLGTSTLGVGILQYMTNGTNFFSGNWPESFTFFGQGYIFRIIPVPVVLFIIVAIVTWFFTEKTQTGKYLYAVGANPVACKYVGIDVNKQKLIGFILCSILSGIAGIIQTSMINSANYGIGDGMMLNGISCIMLGATFLKPGVFNVPGTVVASFLLAVISNGLTMTGVTYYFKDVIQGAILLISVAIIAIIKRDFARSIG